jgi:hypothetical protein
MSGVSTAHGPTEDLVTREVSNLIARAKVITEDVADEVETILRVGLEKPLEADELQGLIKTAVKVMKRSAQIRGDGKAVASLDQGIEELMDKIHAARGAPRSKAKRRTVQLVTHNGIEPTTVLPSPVFHGHMVQMVAGYVKLSDIALWEKNERLEIHLAQFRQLHRRAPTPSELLDIMQSRMALAGVNKDDEFEIPKLADSIAVNGVRRPPIIDVDGTLLDGNRRVAACNFILHSPDFGPREKERVNYIVAWQLTEHATEDARQAVVTSLNFEDDCKEPWPEYVKARKVYEEWQAMLTLDPRASAKQQAQMKRELSQRFALGTETGVVNRYIKMIDLAAEFEDYHVAAKSGDEFEVKHRANEVFQYFDELSKGAGNGVAFALSRDDTFKALVFELLFQGKFRNWRQIRDLKNAVNNEEARKAMRKARDEKDVDEARDIVETALAITRVERAEARELGVNTRIDSFVTWLEKVPLRALEEIEPRNLMRLYKALLMVEQATKAVAKAEATK